MGADAVLSEIEGPHIPARIAWQRRWAKLCCNWLCNRRGEVMTVLGIPHSKRVKFEEFKEHVSPEQLANVIFEQMSDDDWVLWLRAQA